MLLEIMQEYLDKLQETLITDFPGHLQCLILYGSWAKGTAKKDSDIDLLAVFDRADGEMRRKVWEVAQNVGREVTIVVADLEEFSSEINPIYTAIKKEGKVIWGKADLSVHPDPPPVKYAKFFKRSEEFESQKIRIAKDLIDKGYHSGVMELCYVASKHAIQAALAMKGEGYSSKVAILMPLAQKYLGNEIAEAFKRLFDLYVKSEYGMETISGEEAKKAVEYAKVIWKVYSNGAAGSSPRQ